MLKQAGRYARTLRHLRPVQFYGRAFFKLARPKPDLSPAPSLRAASGVFQRPAARLASITGDDEFHFLNEVGSLDADGWDGEHKTKLWRYNLHYFDDLNAEEAVTRRTWHDALIARWIAENPPATGSGWEPYPTSLRIVNWVKTALHGHPLSDATQHSLAVQARWLTKRLEWHLLGNHLFANAKALMFVGFFFDGPEADGWRAQAATILERELTEQFLADGGQFELTPMYHALALEDVLDLVNLWAAFEGGLNARETALAKRCAAMVTEMTAWLSAMSHPDGKVSFFNDTAFKIAPENTELFEYADRLGFPISASTNSLTHLSASGYVRAESGPAVLIADVARVGPDYLPGHAHADTLSFEFSAFDQRVFINSGTSEYGLGPERLRQRGTAAHNTVLALGENSSEVWSGFRVGARARVHDVSVHQGASGATTSARHDGYRRTRSGLDHQRTWTLTETSLEVTDRLSVPVASVARYHLHPDVKIFTADDARSGDILLKSGDTLKWQAVGGACRVEASTWHPEFGLSIESKCLCIDLDAGHASLTLTWSR